MQLKIRTILRIPCSAKTLSIMTLHSDIQHNGLICNTQHNNTQHDIMISHSVTKLSVVC